MNKDVNRYVYRIHYIKMDNSWDVVKNPIEYFMVQRNYDEMDMAFVLSDMKVLVEVLEEAYKEFHENRMDDFIMVYGAACNFVFLYGLHLRNEEEKTIFLDMVGNTLMSDELADYLELIYKGILNHSEKFFHEAIDSIDDYQLPYYYLFLFNARRIDSYTEDNLKEFKEMPKYYAALSDEVKRFAFGESEFNSVKDQHSYKYNLLPYINPVSNSEKQKNGIREVFRECLGEYFELTGKSLDKQVLSREAITDLCSMYIECNSHSKEEHQYSEYTEFRESFTEMFYHIYLSDLDFLEGMPVIGPTSISNENLAFRKPALGLPYEVKTSIDAFKYINKTLELLEEVEEKKRAIEKAESEKNDLIDKHVHNWKHIAYPKTVKEVARKMYKKGETEIANTLFHAYNSQALLQEDLNLLQLQYSGTPQEYCTKFHKSIYSPSDRRGVSIIEVFANALQIVMFRLVMDGVDDRYSINQIKSNLFGTFEIESLRESFVEFFIKNEQPKTDIITWFSNNLYKIDIINEDMWKDAKFKPDGNAYVQMTEVFIDLIHNAINYGLKSSKGYIKLELGNEVIFGREMYSCVMKNPIGGEAVFEGSGQGLKSISEVIRVLNTSNDELGDYEFTDTSFEDNEYSFTFRLPKLIIAKRRR